MQKRLLISVAIVAALAAGAVAFYYYWSIHFSTERIAKEENISVAGYAINKGNDASGKLNPAPVPHAYLFGKVTAINEERVALHTDPRNSINSALVGDFVVRVDATTMISVFAPKNPEIIRKETDAFATSVQSGASSSLPAIFAETTVSLADIEVGDILAVVVSDDQKTSQEPLASEIRIQSQAMLDAAPKEIFNDIK